ncbi:GDF3 factor, partial [Agelaius phoeniceus]|nr:GDF3 factor [Agelaius phoeniceus]
LSVRRAGMWLLRSLAWALLSPVLASELGPQENSLLRSLGLSAKPSPRSPAPVPPVLWRIFHKRRALPRPEAAPEPCRVEEFNVPGNIVRVFADQGTATAAPRSGFPGLRSALPRVPSWIPGEIPAGWSPVDAAGDGDGCGTPRWG